MTFFGGGGIRELMFAIIDFDFSFFASFEPAIPFLRMLSFWWRSPKKSIGGGFWRGFFFAVGTSSSAAGIVRNFDFPPASRIAFINDDRPSSSDGADFTSLDSFEIAAGIGGGGG